MLQGINLNHHAILLNVVMRRSFGMMIIVVAVDAWLGEGGEIFGWRWLDNPPPIHKCMICIFQSDLLRTPYSVLTHKYVHAHVSAWIQSAYVR